MITLSKTLYEEAKQLGIARHESNRSANVPLDIISDDCPYYVDQEGVSGEMAFALLTDADESEWDKIRTIKPTSAVKGEDYGDCDYMGMRFDIKTTAYRSGHLLVMTTKLHSTTIDAYALMTGERGSYALAGCISHGRVLQCIMEGVAPMKSRSTYWIKQSSLRPLPIKMDVDKLRAFNRSQVDAYERWLC